MAGRLPLTRRLMLGHGLAVGVTLPAHAPLAALRAPEPARGVTGVHHHRSRLAAEAQAAALGPRHRHGGGPAPASPRLAAPAVIGRALPLVMLDPGHGGRDPGAIGVSGTYEKHVAFAAAMELGRQLAAEGRFRVRLTRRRDEFIPLETRVALAEAQGAALFVSMHADALPDHRVRGASVYTLSPIASDKQSAVLARHENAADRFVPAGLANVSPPVLEILSSLVRRETRIGAAHVQRRMVAALGATVRVLDNPARHADFAVLRAADIPSVLVEMGFMSNPEDEAALRRPDHRREIASAMKSAVEAYFRGRADAALG